MKKNKKSILKKIEILPAKTTSQFLAQGYEYFEEPRRHPSGGLTVILRGWRKKEKCDN